MHKLSRIMKFRVVQSKVGQSIAISSKHFGLLPAVCGPVMTCYHDSARSSFKQGNRWAVTSCVADKVQTLVTNTEHLFWLFLFVFFSSLFQHKATLKYLPHLHFVLQQFSFREYIPAFTSFVCVQQNDINSQMYTENISNKKKIKMKRTFF